MTTVRAPGLLPNGRIGVRGWCAHCPACSYLGKPKSYRAAEDELRAHRRKHHRKAAA